MNTVFCSNHLCGKEYHESFKKCPFCGTDNPSFHETNSESKQPKSKSEINRDIFRSGIRILISCVAAFAVFVLWVIIFGRVRYLGASLVIATGVSVNAILKKKFPSRNKNQNDVQ